MLICFTLLNLPSLQKHARTLSAISTYALFIGILGGYAFGRSITVDQKKKKKIFFLLFFCPSKQQLLTTIRKKTLAKQKKQKKLKKQKQKA